MDLWHIQQVLTCSFQSSKAKVAFFYFSFHFLQLLTELFSLHSSLTNRTTIIRYSNSDRCEEVWKRFQFTGNGKHKCECCASAGWIWWVGSVWDTQTAARLLVQVGHGSIKGETHRFSNGRSASLHQFHSVKRLVHPKGSHLGSRKPLPEERENILFGYFRNTELIVYKSERNLLFSPLLNFKEFFWT